MRVRTEILLLSSVLLSFLYAYHLAASYSSFSWLLPYNSFPPPPLSGVKCSHCFLIFFCSINVSWIRTTSPPLSRSHFFFYCLSSASLIAILRNSPASRSLSSVALKKPGIRLVFWLQLISLIVTLQPNSFHLHALISCYRVLPSSFYTAISFSNHSRTSFCLSVKSFVIHTP